MISYAHGCDMYLSLAKFVFHPFTRMHMMALNLSMQGKDIQLVKVHPFLGGYLAYSLTSYVVLEAPDAR